MSQQTLNEVASDVDSNGGGDSAEFIPEKCIGFDIAADFAHFKRVGNNSAKPTYRIPPRTTVAGLLAGIMGMERNSYYDLFQPSSSAISVVPVEMPHTYTMGITTVNTKADDAIQYRPKEQHWRSATEMLTPESYVQYDRQRDTYEMLVDPVYRVYVGLRDDEVYANLRDRLHNRNYHYSPALGLSECIAEISNVTVHDVDPSDAVEADSAAYDDSDVVPRPGVQIRRERAPLYMEADDGGRHTTAFGNITYAPGEDSGLPIESSEAYSVGEHTVVFE